jgi:hypothetical protein
MRIFVNIERGLLACFLSYFGFDKAASVLRRSLNVLLSIIHKTKHMPNGMNKERIDSVCSSSEVDNITLWETPNSSVWVQYSPGYRECSSTA